MISIYFFALGNLVILEIREEEYVFRASGINLVLDIHCSKGLGNTQVYWCKSLKMGVNAKDLGGC